MNIQVNKYLSKIVIGLLVIICGWSGTNVNTWGRDRVFVDDVIMYYEYLPAALIFHDLTFSFTKEFPKDFQERIWLGTAPNGKPIVRMTMGLAMLWLPFFLAGHLLANILGLATLGYSWPYGLSIFLAALFYMTMGLVFIRKILLNYFPDWITAITLILTVTATNMMYYVISEPGMSHVYSFSLIAIFFYCTLQWIKKPGVILSICLGLLAGLIVLVRPVNGLVLVFPAFIGIRSFSGFKSRIIGNWKFIGIAGLSAIMIASPQLIYWKAQTGHFIFNSYMENGKFYFLNPHILKGLFSFRNGWLPYTPVMFLALGGLFVLEKYVKGIRNATLIFLFLFTYVIYSWWCWWYGGSFGSRPMIDTYGILALPLAASLMYLFQKPVWIKIVLGILLAALLYLNQFQLLQRRMAVIHWDSMTKEAYMAIFLKKQIPADYDKLIQMPDYKSALRGEKEYAGDEQSRYPFFLNDLHDTGSGDYHTFYFNDFEKDVPIIQENQVTAETRHSGKKSILLKPDYPFSPSVEVLLINLPDTNNITLKSSVWVLNPSTDERGKIMLVVSTNDSLQKPYMYKTVRDTTASYKPGEWFQISRTDLIDRNVPVKGTFKVYVWYTGKNKIFVDDLKLEYKAAGK